MADPIVLSYGDSLVRRSDLDILNSCQWLNDQIIGFFFEVCQKQKFQGSDLSFVGPEVSQFVKMVPQSEIGIFLEPLDLSSQKGIFFAVNSQSDPSQAGGTHWSLLVYVKSSKQFLHFDSCKGSNRHEAKILAKKVGTFLLADDFSLNFLDVESTQQVNGYDCGIHCIANAENIATHLKDGKDILDLKKVELNTISGFRAELVNLINCLSSSK